MRNAILLPLSVLFALTSATIDAFAPFSPPNVVEQDIELGSNTTLVELELVKRANCNSCSTLGAASVCCTSNGICTYDWAGHVACCWAGTSCTGTIGGTGAVSATTGFLNTISASTTTTTATVAQSTVTEGGTTTSAAGAASTNGIVIIQVTGGSTTGAGAAAFDKALARRLFGWVGLAHGITRSLLRT